MAETVGSNEVNKAATSCSIVCSNEDIVQVEIKIPILQDAYMNSDITLKMHKVMCKSVDQILMIQCLLISYFLGMTLHASIEINQFKDLRMEAKCKVYDSIVTE